MQGRSSLYILLAAGLSLVAAPLAAQPSAIDFGDDSSDYPGDGECDDMRFSGPGMSSVMLTDDIGRDATDCRAAFDAGRIRINPLFAKPANDAAIIFGDDASDYANDGECDDIRFVGAGSDEAIYLAEDVGHDAADCRAGFRAGTLRWQGHLATIVRGITANELMEAD